MPLTREEIHELVALKKALDKNFDEDSLPAWLQRQGQINADPIAAKLARALKLKVPIPNPKNSFRRISGE